MVKRKGNLFGLLVSEETIREAYRRSRRGRTHRRDVRDVDADPVPHLAEVRRMLMAGEYRSGAYRSFTVRDGGKEREVHDIDYFPHRIVHWALILTIRPTLMGYIGDCSYAAMEGRGIHLALTRLRKALREDPERTQWCFKMDVVGFFRNIDKGRMMAKIERRIKDPRILELCREIVFGYPGPGLPVGNLTSQYFANLYLADVDRHMKQVFHCEHYYRYMDDIVVLGESKAWLRRVKVRMDRLLREEGLEMKGNWQIFRVEDRGIDFVGYRIFHDFCLLRKGTKTRLRRACAEVRAKLDSGGVPDAGDRGRMASYSGILQWCDGHRLARETVCAI